MPKVSVIIRVHATADYLPLSIHSVMQQNLQDFEILIIDHSLNGYSNIIQRFNDKRIKYYKINKQLTATEALLMGVELSVGKYIGILDWDDLYLPDNLYYNTKLLDMSDNKVALICGRCFIINGGNVIVKKDKKRNTTTNFLYTFAPTQGMPGPAILYRKNSLEFLIKMKNCFVVNTLLEDVQIQLLLLKNGFKFFYHNKIISMRRLHSNNNTAKHILYARDIFNHTLLVKHHNIGINKEKYFHIYRYLITIFIRIYLALFIKWKGITLPSIVSFSAKYLQFINTIFKLKN